MSKDSDRIDALEEQVVALQEFHNKIAWAASTAKAAWAAVGISVVTVATLLGTFLWSYSKINSEVDTHKRQLEIIQAQFEKPAEKLDAKFEKIAEKLDAKIDRIAERLDAKIDKVHSRLTSWEDKRFRTVNLVFRDGEFVALEGMTIAIKEDNQLRVFTVNPLLKIKVNDKDIELKAAKLAAKTPIRFFVADDNVQVIAIELK